MARTKLESLGISQASSEEKTLIRLVDESQYSKEEWEEALQEFKDWLESKSRPYVVTIALEYIHCCSQASEKQTLRQPLRSVLLQMLNDFGFEGKKQSC